MNTAAVIQSLVAPVVMISACGLLCLAFYNRLAAIVGRARAFAHERHLAQRQLRSGHEPALRQRIATLEDQVARILKRARLIRVAIYCLLLTVLLMLLCSLCMALSLLILDFGSIALFPFIGGVLTMIIGVVFAILELRDALDPVAVEHATLREENLPAE